MLDYYLALLLKEVCMGLVHLRCLGTHRSALFRILSDLNPFPSDISPTAVEVSVREAVACLNMIH